MRKTGYALAALNALFAGYWLGTLLGRNDEVIPAAVAFVFMVILASGSVVSVLSARRWQS